MSSLQSREATIGSLPLERLGDNQLGKEFSEQQAVSEKVVTAVNFVMGKTNSIEQSSLLQVLEGEELDSSKIDVNIAAKITQLRALVLNFLPETKDIEAFTKQFRTRILERRICGDIDKMLNSPLAQNIGEKEFIRALIAYFENGSHPGIMPKHLEKFKNFGKYIKENVFPAGDSRDVFVVQLKKRLENGDNVVEFQSKQQSPENLDSERCISLVEELSNASGVEIIKRILKQASPGILCVSMNGKLKECKLTSGNLIQQIIQILEPISKIKKEKPELWGNTTVILAFYLEQKRA